MPLPQRGSTHSPSGPLPSEAIDEAMIVRLVGTFYTCVRADPVLAPVFADHIEDWDTHIERMWDFWSSVMLRTGRYSGRPMAVHAPLPVTDAHFRRWLALFEMVARKSCPETAAEQFIDRAQRIATSLQYGVAMARGECPSRVQAVAHGA
ncbi:group III truncated hemoglobin [Glycocaulis sp.]